MTQLRLTETEKRDFQIQSKGQEISSRFPGNEDLRKYISRLQGLVIRDRNKKRKEFMKDLAIECQLRLIDRLHV